MTWLRAQRGKLNREGAKASSYTDALIGQHPSGQPMHHPPLGLPVIVEPPSTMSSTERWIAHRDRWKALVEMHPDNEACRAYLEAAEAVLSWRAALPEDMHFWMKRP